MDLPMFYNKVEEWQHTRMLYEAALKEINTKLEILNREFQLAHQYNPIEHITSRIKSPKSIAKKLGHNNKDITIDNIIEHVHDVAGVRIICSFTSDIYRIADLITKQKGLKVIKIKDYIQYPKKNGYKSYHMIVSIPVNLSNQRVDTKVEIQIRTIAMDFWASLEHKIYYKFEGNAPEYIREELKECSNIVAYLDEKMLSINEEVKAYNDGMEVDNDKLAAKSKPIVKETSGFIIDEEQDKPKQPMNKLKLKLEKLKLGFKT